MIRYKIAGVTVDIDVKYERLKKQGKPYEIPFSNTPADICLSLDQKVYEKARIRFPNLNDENLEYLLYGFMFYDKLLDFGGIMLHASAVAVGGYAYLFSADSGVGKSTHTSYYLEYFKEKAVIINDDKPALREINGKFYCFGTPFSGKHDISINKGYLLGGICFLSRADANKIEKINSQEALKLIYKQTQSMNGSDRIEKRLNILDKLLNSADLYKMQCVNNVSAAAASFEKMKKSIPVELSEVDYLLEKPLNNGKTVKFRTKGGSMYPILISDRDSVILKKKKKLRKNDVVLFKDEQENYVLHRIKKIKGDIITTRGDALTYFDAPVKKDKVIATAIGFERNGKTISASNIFYKLFFFVYTCEIMLKIRKLRHK